MQRHKLILPDAVDLVCLCHLRKLFEKALFKSQREELSYSKADTVISV